VAINSEVESQTSLARELVPLHPNESSARLGEMIYERMGRKGSLNAAKQAVYKARGDARKGVVRGSRGGRQTPKKERLAFPEANGTSNLPPPSFSQNANETYTTEQLQIIQEVITKYRGGPTGKTVLFTRAMTEHPEWKKELMRGGRTMQAIYAKVAGVRRKMEEAEKAQASQLPVPTTQHQEVHTQPRRNQRSLPPLTPLAIRHCPRCGKSIYLCHHCNEPEKECRNCGESILAWSNIASVLQGLPR